jgi:hypothetical protein
VGGRTGARQDVRPLVGQGQKAIVNVLEATLDHLPVISLVIQT